MTYHRKNVWELGGDWADPILWYARGVLELKKRPLADPTSWNFYGAIHGFNATAWRDVGFPTHAAMMPSAQLQKQYWKQCQHGSWYFLPWHRGYLLAFENLVRAAIVGRGGPATWALPYWNYFKPGQAALPPAFASPQWPDGANDNPLFVAPRYGPTGNGHVVIPMHSPNPQFHVDLAALNEPDFSGHANGGSTGFGGVDTGFSHSGNTHGRLESDPHDVVHVLIGGLDPATQIGGLMSDPDTAGLDPIFWLHHANIDRLWEVWLGNPAGVHHNSTSAAWLKGPLKSKGRVFTLPTPTGSAWPYTPADMVSLPALGYDYDEVTAAATPTPLAARFARLGIAAPSIGVVAMANQNRVELVGASSGVIAVEGADTRRPVQLRVRARRRLATSLTATEARTPASPDRVFLNLENVRSQSDAVALRVYVGLADDQKSDDHPELLAGMIGLFGARKATDKNGEHGGQGLTYVLEITNIVDQLHIEQRLDVDTLDVRIVPVNPVASAARVRIGRISIYRQST